MSLVERLDTLLSMSGSGMTESQIIGGMRELFFERPEREALQQALREHPAVVPEGLTYRMDPVRHADWLAARFGL